MVVEKQRFWPSLYDRLRQRDAKGIDDYFVDAPTLREMVKRDLELLLNVTSLETSDDLENYPHIRASVINYGVIGVTGRTVSTLNDWQIQERLRESLANFEPRIVSDSLRVRVATDGHTEQDEEIDGERGLMLTIAGTILGTPMPEDIYITTRWDMELGEAEVTVE